MEEEVFENVPQEIPANDGSGLYDNLGLIDTLTVDCNELIKALVSGQYVHFSVVVVGMVQKLANLRNGVKNDTESLQKQLEEYKRLIDDINSGKGA